MFVQAWYQGGASIADFTDSSNPVEIGYFDRGPVNGTSLVRAGAVTPARLRKIDKALDNAKKLANRGRLGKAGSKLRSLARDLKGHELADLRDAVEDLAATFPADDDSDSDSD